MSKIRLGEATLSTCRTDCGPELLWCAPTVHSEHSTLTHLKSSYSQHSHHLRLGTASSEKPTLPADPDVLASYDLSVTSDDYRLLKKLETDCKDLA